MARDKLLIIDGNNLLHRAYNKFSSMVSSDGKKSSIIYGFPFILSPLIRLLKPTDVLVVFDGARDKERLKILPDYKGGREGKRKDEFDRDDFEAQKKILKNVLSCLGIPYTTPKGREADDLIWLFCRRYRWKGSSIILSTDKDFHQLLSHKLSIWHPWKKERITHKNVEKLYGYSPEECVDWLTLCGDKSDNIQGIKGIGPKTARKFLDQYGSLKNYVKGEGPEYKKMTRAAAEEVFLEAQTLINIRKFCRRHIPQKEVVVDNPSKGYIDDKELRCIASDYSITTFYKPNFIKPFKDLLT